MAIGRLVVAAFASLCLAIPTRAYASAHIVVVNGNVPGVGFNDPTPVAPVGGNPGTTVGDQRLRAFQFAADRWGETLDSIVDVVILATFEPLTCTATTAVLGLAGPTFAFRDFPGALLPGTWYVSALADKLTGTDVAGSDEPDIVAQFNSNLGQVGCLTGTGWYLGFDQDHGANVDLVTVLEHEFAHGLGFLQTASISNGALLDGFRDAYNRLIFDNTTGKHWDEMTDAERVASAKNPRHVVFDGATVTRAVPSVLQVGTPILRITSPGVIAGTYAVGTAAFGQPLGSPGTIGHIVLGLDAADAAGPSTTDACSPFTNAAAVAGQIALVDRGTCGFAVKVKNAQNAGAIAVIIADNMAGSPPSGLGGTDATITIPAVRVTLADGNTIKGQLAAGVIAMLGLDLGTRAGTELGRALLFTPDPIQPGSSVSHWDPVATPNQLMEPSFNSDLTHSVEPPEDLTLPLLRDIGWFPDRDLDLVDDGVDECPGSDLRATVFVGRENTGVANAFFANGCTIADLIANIGAGATNHGGFVSGAAHLLNSLKKAGIITDKDKGIIQSAAARSSIP
jgi:hypothetical protein